MVNPQILLDGKIFRMGIRGLSIWSQSHSDDKWMTDAHGT
jgi:hypothetical protein